MKKKLVSMSLYGDKPMYHMGAIMNAKLMPEIYPGWTLRIYAEQGYDYSELKRLGAEIIPMHQSRGSSGMFWRFMAAFDVTAERVIFRDADSRINVREACAVEAWIRSGKDAHCMHDHPHHRILPLSGGMWGVKVGVLPQKIRKEIARAGRTMEARVEDMKYLARRVYPLIEYSLLRHTSVVGLKSWKGGEPFPEHPPYPGFVGQQYDENDKAIGATK